MKANIRIYVAVILLAIVISSCGNHAPKEAKYIPNDIAAVVAVDPKNMQDKLEKAGISMDTLINRLLKRDGVDTADKTKFNEIKDGAGIDWNEKLFFFGLKKVDAKKGNANVWNILCGLNSVPKFEAYLKNQGFLSNKNIQKEKNYSFVIISNGSMISWDDKTVIGTMFDREIKPYYDTVAMKFVVPQKANFEADMKAEVNRYFTQATSASIASNKAFGDLFKTKSDGYAFTSANSYLSVLSGMPLQLPKLEEFIKDNYLASTLSFENGKIVATATSYTNPLVSNLLKKYAGPTVNLSLIDHYPSDNINMIMLASFNPAIFGGVLKELEVEGIVNGFMEKTGFSSQELYKCLKGDIAVVVSDLGIEAREKENKKDAPFSIGNKRLGKMIFNAPVGDAVSFEKIMDKCAELGYVTKQGKVFKAGNLLSSLGMYVVADDKNLIIASDSITYTQYISNKNKSVISNDALNLFKGKSTVAYFDIANTINGFLPVSNGGFKNSMNTAKNIFKDMIASSDNFDGNSVKGKFEIRLNDEKQNSLVTLTSLFLDIAVDMRVAAKKDREQEDKEKIFPSGVPAIIRTN